MVSVSGAAGNKAASQSGQSSAMISTHEWQHSGRESLVKLFSLVPLRRGSRAGGSQRRPTVDLGHRKSIQASCRAHSLFGRQAHFSICSRKYTCILVCPETHRDFSHRSRRMARSDQYSK